MKLEDVVVAVVDDDETCRMLMEDILKRNNLDIVACYQSYEKLLNSMIPDLVFGDFNIQGGMTGGQFITKYNNMFGDRFIGISADPYQYIQLKPLPNMISVISKPSDYDTINRHLFNGLYQQNKITKDDFMRYTGAI